MNKYLERKLEILEGRIRELEAEAELINYTPQATWSDHKQKCPTCKRHNTSDCNWHHEKLHILHDYASGGTHYYHLMCENCTKEFYYDNHRSKLEKI